MNLRLFSTFLSLALLAGAGCATPSPVRVKAGEDLTVVSWGDSGERRETPLKKGEVAALTAPINRLVAPNHLDLAVILPRTGASSKLDEAPWEVHLKPVTEWRGERTEDYISQETDRLYLSLLQVLESLRANRKNEALTLISEVVAKHPKLASALYVKAQVEVVNGETPKAIQSLAAAVNLRPGFTEALELKRKLEARGGK